MSPAVKTILALSVFLGIVCSGKGGFVEGAEHKKNHLADAKSPYLLEHADNPVDWYPWGEEAFEKARREDKPIFLSIGYSTCHWCHVMERESFENEDIAALLNKHFVSIKVDREERPDIDNLYMPAVIMLSGSGGWPMSLFLTPDRKPFAGGTYFPPESRFGRVGFRDVLQQIHRLWTTDRQRLEKAGDEVLRNLQRQAAGLDGKAGLDEGLLDKAYQSLAARFDGRYGGFGSAPKFPSAHTLSFLLRYADRRPQSRALAMVEKTLTAMAEGGIYDHLGGGFHRYSTDAQWQVPHFEKMLYDQAIVSRAYLEAWTVSPHPLWETVVRETLDYVLRDMRDPQGGFYSAEDADSFDSEQFAGMTLAPEEGAEKKEGAFYLWRWSEVKALLTDEEAAVVIEVYGLSPQGNIPHDPMGEFAGKNILWRRTSDEEAAARLKMTPETVGRRLASAREKLLTARQERPRPNRDEKILTDWNGLMISSLATAGSVLKEPLYIQAAEKAAQFILKTMTTPEGGLWHRYFHGDASVEGHLDDYAFFIHGLLDLYEATGKVLYLREAVSLNAMMLAEFWDDRQGGFFFTSSDNRDVLVRQKLVYDGAYPSGNSIAVLDLLRLGRMTMNTDGESRAQKLLEAFSVEMHQAPSAHAQVLSALDWALGPTYEIVFAANESDPGFEAMTGLLFSRFFPRRVVLYRPRDDRAAEDIARVVPFVAEQKPLENKATVYVCRDYRCQRPTTELEVFEKQLGLSSKTAP